MSDIYYWDANIFLSYINGMPDRVPIIDDYFARARRGDCQIFTSTWSITEVAFETNEKGTRVLSPDIEKKVDSFWADRSVIKLVEVFPYLQREARRLMRDGIPKGWSLKPVDALHLATAISDVVKASEFHTYDDLKRYEAIAGIKIGPPNPQQGVLIGLSPAPLPQQKQAAIPAPTPTGQIKT